MQMLKRCKILLTILLITVVISAGMYYIQADKTENLFVTAALLYDDTSCIEEEICYDDEAINVAKAEQDFVIAIEVEPENLDPLKMITSPEANVAEHMVQTLVYLAEDGNLEPSLAESWEPTAEGDGWLLNLREGVTFHDGEPWISTSIPTCRAPTSRPPRRPPTCPCCKPKQWPSMRRLSGGRRDCPVR